MKMPIPRMDKLTFMGEAVPKKAMSDPDVDGYPNAVDCSNKNRNKQGFIKKLSQKWKDYKTAAPQRRQAKMEKAEYNLKMQKLREEKMQSQTRMQSQRLSLMQKRQKMMGKAPSMMGSPTMFGPSLTKAVKPKRKAKKKKKKVVVYV